MNRIMETPRLAILQTGANLFLEDSETTPVMVSIIIDIRNGNRSRTSVITSKLSSIQFTPHSKIAIANVPTATIMM